MYKLQKPSAKIWAWFTMASVLCWCCVPTTPASTNAYVELQGSILQPPVEDFSDFGFSLKTVIGSVVAVGAPGGPDGAEDEGAVFIFSGTGEPQSLLSNPNASAQNPRFGTALAVIEGPLIAVGAPGDDGNSITNRGAVYLLTPSGGSGGALFSPSPNAEESFGQALARLGASNLVVGAPGADEGRGAAYILDTENNLLGEIKPPEASTGDGFGYSVAVLNNSTIAVGSMRGEKVLLADTSGNVFRTLLSPAEERTGFGNAVAALPGTGILVGAPGSGQASPPPERRGAVYLYDGDGAWSGTFYSPSFLAGGLNDRFGHSVSPIGSGYFVVGAPFADSKTREDTGAAYLYDRKGRLLRRIRNPKDEPTLFGASVEGVTTNRFLVGAPLGESVIAQVGTLTNGLVYSYDFTVFEPDSFEPDDTRRSARQTTINTPERHNFHEPGDVDWVKFFAVPNYEYRVEIEPIGGNAQPVLRLRRQRPNGTLEDVPINPQGQAEGPAFSSVSVTNARGEMYYIAVSNLNLNATGKTGAPEAAPASGGDTDYLLEVIVDGVIDALAVVVVDLLVPGGSNSPPNTQVVIDHTDVYDLYGSNVITLTEISSGLHTVEVLVPEGYLPDEDPEFPGQVQNPDNLLFGNPKNVEVLEGNLNFATFVFTPSIRVDGSVRDRFTREYVSGAALSFEALSGVVSGVVYTQYPNFAVYGTPFVTDQEGRFPTNVILPDVDWSLAVEAEGYEAEAQLLNGLTPGATTNLGMLMPAPVDANSNNIADAWENAYFGSDVTSGDDADGDGYDNGTEYRLGSDPTNAASLLAFELPVVSNGFCLAWPAAPGRSYRVLRYTNLVHAGAAAFFGPWTAGVQQTSMKWADDDYGVTNFFYRLDALLPAVP